MGELINYGDRDITASVSIPRDDTQQYEKRAGVSRPHEVLIGIPDIMKLAYKAEEFIVSRLNAKKPAILDVNVSGPSGSGKTTAFEQLFHLITGNSQISESNDIYLSIINMRKAYEDLHQVGVITNLISKLDPTDHNTIIMYMRELRMLREMMFIKKHPSAVIIRLNGLVGGGYVNDIDYGFSLDVEAAYAAQANPFKSSTGGLFQFIRPDKCLEYVKRHGDNVLALGIFLVGDHEQRNAARNLRQEVIDAQKDKEAVKKILEQNGQVYPKGDYIDIAREDIMTSGPPVIMDRNYARFESKIREDWDRMRKYYDGKLADPLPEFAPSVKVSPADWVNYFQLYFQMYAREMIGLSDECFVVGVNTYSNKGVHRYPIPQQECDEVLDACLKDATVRAVRARLERKRIPRALSIWRPHQLGRHNFNKVPKLVEVSIA